MFERLRGAINCKTAGYILLITGIILLLFSVAVNHYKKSTITEQPDPPEQQQVLPAEPEPSKSYEFLPISGRLVIPCLELDLEIGYGVSEEDLKKEPGFYPQSGHPDTGNVCIAGHLNAYGSPFLNLSKLQPGDKIELSYDGKIYTYQVEKVFIVDEYDWSVIDPTDEPAITLTTCHPLHPVNGKYDRLIVRGLQTSATAADESP